MKKHTDFIISENEAGQAKRQNLLLDSGSRKVICSEYLLDHKFNNVFERVKNRKFRPFSNASAIKSSISLSIILNAIMLLGYIYNNNIVEPLGFRLLYMLLTDILLFYLLYIFNFKIILLNWKKSSKIWLAIFGSIFIAVAFSLIFSECTILIYPIISSQITVNFLFIANIIKDLIFVLIVLISTLLFYSVFQRQQTLLENEKLIAENIRIRYEVLKSQVDPHFLFNSLNTLDGLIGVDDDKAHNFVENISSVFRYTTNNKEIMHLDEELDFTESYAGLMKIRYGDNFQVQYNIEEKYRRYYIMPISLQLLVENAIKHNVISKKYSFIITIETTPNGTIRVINPIQLKQDAEPGTGIGLANLTERYKLLFQKEVIITITDVFCVEIPLIKQLENTKTNLL